MIQLDTVVVSERRRACPNRRLIAWLVAATAAAHGLTVATRNVRHFAPTGVSVFDPFKPA